MAISKLDLPEDVPLHRQADAQQLARAQALAVAAALASAIEQRGQATLVVSGGRSPIAFFKELAEQPLAWNKVLISLADERWVPPCHEDSNEALVRRYLLQGAAAEAHLLGLYQSAASLDEAALIADGILQNLANIDVLILGMGTDGHTASLFPASPNLVQALSADCTRRCLPMLAPNVPHQRLSMTAVLLKTARLTLLAIEGQGKLSTLQQALHSPPESMPIRAFIQSPLEIYWCP